MDWPSGAPDGGAANGSPTGAPRGAPDVVVFGSLNLDHVVTVEELPKPGQTVGGSSYISVPGGKGLNQAVAASRQGARVAMVACAGEDAPGGLLLGVLSREAIVSGGVRRAVAAPTGTALITVARGGANTIVVAAGANGELGAADVEAAREVLTVRTVVLAQLEIPLPAVGAALHLSRERGSRAVLNPSPVEAGFSPELLELVDVLVPNEGEALAISGRATVEQAADWFLGHGCGAVAITLGEAGALVAQPGRSTVHVRAFSVDAVDTTAAGDAFCGALAAALAGGHDLLEAAKRGCAAGALAATVLGAVPSLPSKEAVDRILSGQVE
ncbi:MAG TPA: ribokinase [Acidimicrobiales bacterium]|nr:ribokinase [Acidimicrobiales bacterium]